MKLSISNIAWSVENDEKMYSILAEFGYTGLEIAPTRIFPEEPYSKLEKAEKWHDFLKQTYNLEISSMQSIWFGRQERVFGEEEERKILIAYTKKAIDFAEAIECKNLVFGCPRNRNLPDGIDSELAILFYKELGDYAYEHKTTLAIEANPPIYNTNYINDTASAISLIKKVNSRGFMLNLDVGTMIFNKESIDELKGDVKFINHVHISEPGLDTIQIRELHKNLIEVLKKEKYNKYISVEMGKQDDLSVIQNKMRYVKYLVDQGKD